MSEENTGASTESSEPARDPVGDFKNMPGAEKLLACAAAVVLLAILVIGNWNYLFKMGWFRWCAFFGALGSLALVGLHLFGVKLMDAKTRIYVVVALAMLPMIGFIVDALSNFWHALKLAGSVAMAMAAMKITGREKLIKKSGD